MTVGVLDVCDVEAAGVVLDVLEDTDATDVVAADDEDECAVLELDEAFNLASLKVQLLVKRVYLI